MLKILTYNIHKGFSTTSARFVLPEMKTAIETINPDIVFLQEIQGRHRGHELLIDSWPKESQSEFLAGNYWPYFAYGKNASYEVGHHGNAILSKFPFIAWENIDVSRFEKSSRSVLHGILDIPQFKIPLHAICIHFGLFKFERVEQLKTLCDRIQSHVPPDEPLIIAGDFNDWLAHAEQVLELRLNLQEVFKELMGGYARSFPVWGPALQVDRIYYRNLDVINCERFYKLHWRRLSDHAPLYAEFVENE